MVTRGNWNVCFGAVGVVGSGKTTWNCSQLIKIADHNQCWIIAHDPDRRIPPRLPSGRAVATYHHPSPDAAAAAMRSTPTGIHCIDVDDAYDVVTFGTRLAGASLKANGGHRGTPVLIYVDEAVRVRKMGPHAPPHELLAVITGRRWLNVGFVWGSQFPQSVHNQVIGQGNQLAMFRITHGLALKNLEVAGVPRTTVQQLPTLPQYHCRLHKFGF